MSDIYKPAHSNSGDIIEIETQPLMVGFDRAAILAKNTKPKSLESQAIADKIFKRIDGIDILPSNYTFLEVLAFVSSEASDESARVQSKTLLLQKMNDLSVKTPDQAKGIALNLRTSLLCDQGTRGEMLIMLVDLVGDDAMEIQNLARGAGELNEQQRLNLLVKITERLIEQPYEMVMALREFCDAADWTECPIASTAYDVLSEYSQSPSYIAEVLEREFNVRIQSIPAVANDDAPKPLLTIVE